jgi:GPH family glycoside/pentoside/hexuronide:cation symporter
MLTQVSAVGLRASLSMGGLSLPLAFFSMWVYVYLPSYFFSQWGLSLAVIGAVMLLARLTDVLTDVWVGHLSDAGLPRVSRPWQMVLAAGVLLPLSLMLVAPWGEGLSAFWLLMVLMSVFFAWTWLAVPYQALMADWVEGLDDKLKLNGVKEAFAVLGVVLLLVWPVLMGLPSDAPVLMLQLWGLFAFSLLMGVALLFFYPQPARARAGLADEAQALTGRKILQVLKNSQGFRALLWPYFVNQLANALPATLFVLFVTHALGLGEAVGVLLLTYFFAGLLALPGWLWLAKRIGLVGVWQTSVGLAILGFSGLVFVEAVDFWGFWWVCVISGLSLGIDLAAPNSLQAQWIQQEEARLGQKVSGVFFGVWGLFTKLALALAVGLALPMLDWMGLSTPTQGAELSQSAAYGLWGLYALVPIVLKLWALRLLLAYRPVG